MSLFTQFINLREKISDEYVKNVQFLNCLKTDTSETNSDSVLLSNGYSTKFLNGIMQIMDTNGNIIHSINPATGTYLDMYVSGTTLKVTDVIDEVSDGATISQVCGELATKYSYCTRIKATDINDLISNYQLAEADSFKQDLFSATDDDGYISRTSFIGIFKSWITRAKRGSDNNNPSLDTTNPYTLNCFLRIAVTVVTSSLAIICTALSTFFGALGYVLAGIFNMLGNIVSQYSAAGDMEYDPLAGNTYITGPIGCITGAPLNVQFHQSSDTYDHIFVSEFNGVAIFSWFNDNEITFANYRSNVYFYPYFKPYAMAKWLKDNGYIELDRDTANQTVYHYIQNWYNKGFTGWDESLIYGENEGPQDLIELGMSLAIGFIVQSIVVASIQFGNTYTEYKLMEGYYGQAPSWTAATDEKLAAWAGQILHACASNVLPANNSSLKTVALNSFPNALANYIKEYMMPTRERMTNRSANLSNMSVISSGSNTFWPCLYSPQFANNIFYNVNVGANIIHIYPKPSTVIDSEGFCDCLPTSWGVKLPSLDTAAINSVLIAAALVTTVVFIQGTKLKIHMAKRRAGKEALRAGLLNKAREDFINDPDNANKRKTYEDMAYKYNKMGKWFGWGSYDSLNGWVNQPSGDSDTAASTPILSSIASRLGLSSDDDVDKITLKALVDELHTLCSSIKDLIKV